MKWLIRVLVFFFLLGTFRTHASERPQTEHKATFCIAGGTETGVSLLNAGMAGCIGGNVSSSPHFAHYPGGVSARVWFPALDTDQDGLPDEIDTDNDNDGLSDQHEIEGTAFPIQTVTDVNSPDSDGDGVSDGQEALAKTDPEDATQRLRLLSIERKGSDVVLHWQACAGTRYRVCSMNQLGSDERSRILAEVTADQKGVGSWLTCTNAFVDVGAAIRSTNRINVYSIQVITENSQP